MSARERVLIFMTAGIGLVLLCIVPGCSGSRGRGPQQITGSQMTLMPGNMSVSVPDTIDTVMIAADGLFNGREFQLDVQTPEVLFLAEGPAQRFHDATGGLIDSLWGCDGVVTSTVPLRYYPQSPCVGALLKKPGNYLVTLHVSQNDSIWEIDELM